MVISYQKIAKDIMTLKPAIVPVGTKMEDALLLMNDLKVTTLLIIKIIQL